MSSAPSPGSQAGRFGCKGWLEGHVGEGAGIEGYSGGHKIGGEGSNSGFSYHNLSTPLREDSPIVLDDTDDTQHE